MNFVAIDFETANEQRDSACAVGLALVEGGRVVQTVYHLIRPPSLYFSPWNVGVHGITAKDVRNAPTLAALWPAMRRLIEGRLVVAHNASFDVSVLRHSLCAHGLATPDIEVLCSLRLSRKAWPHLASHSLGFLAACCEIELDHHHAESDAVAASELLLRMGQERTIHCPLQLAEALGVAVGRLFPDGKWLASSKRRIAARATRRAG